MNFKSTTLLGLFDASRKSFTIPVYQRAYAWEKKEWQTFLDDLIEQTEGNNPYFFGNILLETVIRDVSYEVIDGQQRLTTLSIFMRSLLDVLQKEGAEVGVTAEVIEEKKRVFLKNGGVIKLRPVSYDTACFDALITEGLKSFEVATPSQKRILDAKHFFTQELKKLSATVLAALLDKIETTEVTTIELQEKKDAALMFELQNNRGKDLTNMERLKSYFMYQMYVYSPPEETESNISQISDIFKAIYGLINDIKLIDEDSVLIYHCNSYVKGYYYRTLDDIKERFKSTEEKVNWIMEFIRELHTSFSNIKRLEHNRDQYLMRMRSLEIPAFVFPFLIKGYKYFGSDDGQLSALFHIMEILVFRYRLINSRADLISRLNSILTSFDGNVAALSTSLKTKMNESYYWGDYRTKEVLDTWMYENRVLPYLLWQYEAQIQRKGYKIVSMKLENQQIEHISPQIPPEGEELASGYEVNADNKYSDGFVRDYLNCLGNLMLISGSHNASIGNRPFREKLQSYIENPLLKQQLEIKEFKSGANDAPLWNEAAIDRRHAVIHDFAVKTWSFESVTVLEVMRDSLPQAVTEA